MVSRSWNKKGKEVPAARPTTQAREPMTFICREGSVCMSKGKEKAKERGCSRRRGERKFARFLFAELVNCASTKAKPKRNRYLGVSRCFATPS
jgi:hypothetical protein